MRTPAPGACGECAAALAPGQRYCLRCGARVDAPGPTLRGLMQRAAASWPEREPAAAQATAAEAPPPSPVAPRAASRPGLPPARVSVLLVAAFLGFGTLLGAAAGSPVRDGRDEAGSPLRLVVPAAGAPAAAAATAPSGEASATSEPPPAESEPTPASAGGSSLPAKAQPAGGQEAPGSSPSSGEGGGSSGPPAATKLPPIRHVFLIALSDEPYATVFGPASPAHYLTGTLERRGELLVRYDAVAHAQLSGAIALLSGQGPTNQIAANCPAYTDIAPATAAADGQVSGDGCVFPAATQTLPGQLAARRLSWRAYVQGIDEAGASAPACAHPAPGAADPSAVAGSGPYATYRNPLVYFRSITDSPACASGDVGLRRLRGDLRAVASTPSLAYISPDRCHDGDSEPCSPGAPAGMAPADAFLAQVVPEILASAAYRRDGLIVITVDEAPSTGELADSSSCCGQPQFPNLAADPGGGLAPRGGGTVGALLISRYVKAAATTQEQFNHFSLLRTLEDLFSVEHLGYAGLRAVKPLPPSLFLAKPAR